MCSMYCCFTAASCIASSSFPDNPATLFFPILEAASSRLSHSPASSKPRHTALSLSSLVSLSFCHSVSLDSLFQNLQGQVCFYRYTIHFTRNPKSQESASSSSSKNVTMPPLPDSDNPNIEKTDLSFLCLSSLDSLSSKSSNVRFAPTVIWFTSRRNPKAQQSSSSFSFFLPPPLPLTMQQQKYRHSPTLTIIKISRKTVLVLQREARSKDLLCPCVETQSKQKQAKACWLALPAAVCFTKHKKKSCPYCVCACIVIEKKLNGGGSFLYPTPLPFLPPPPSFPLHHLLVLAFLNNN